MPYVDHCCVEGNRLLMQINAYLDFNPFSLGFLGSDFPKE